MVGLEDHATSLGGVEFRENFLADLLAVARLPYLDVAVSTDTELVAILFPELDAVQARFRLERVIAVDSHLDKVFEDQFDVAAAVVDDRQIMCVALADHGGDPRLEIGAPVVW